MTQQQNTKPLVSILICNYNYGRFIATAIDSALAQTYPNIEIIVVDDGSTDNSREVIESYSDRVRAIFQQNGGQSSAFNAAFAASSGEIICLLDSDDFFLADKVAKAVQGYAKNPSAKWLFHPLHRVHESDGNMGIQEPLGDSRILDYRRRTNKFTAPPTTGLTFLRSTFARMVPLPEKVRIVADNYMKFVSMALYPGFYLTEPLGVLLLHGKNAYSMGVTKDRRAQSDIEIASAIRSHFPNLTPQADRLISITLAKYWRLPQCDAPTAERQRAYLRDSSVTSKARIYAGAAFRCLKRSTLGVTPFVHETKVRA